MSFEQKAVGSVGKRGGGKLARSETVTVRLDPKLRYLAELAARRQRRTVSSFIEWAIEEGLKRVKLSDENTSVADQALELWDVDDPDRFLKLAFRWPELLTHEEQVLWKLIRENGVLWRGHRVLGEWTWSVEEKNLRFDLVREYWHLFCAVAKGTASKSTLPDWASKPDEEVPF